MLKERVENMESVIRTLYVIQVIISFALGIVLGMFFGSA